MWGWVSARLLQMHQELQAVDWQTHFSFSRVDITEKVEEGFDESQSVLGAPWLRGTWPGLSILGASYGSPFKSLAPFIFCPVTKCIAWSISHESQVSLLLIFMVLPKIQVTILTTCRLSK